MFFLNCRVPTKAISGETGRIVFNGRPGGVQRGAAVTGQRPARFLTQSGQRLSRDEGQLQRNQLVRHLLLVRARTAQTDPAFPNGHGRLRLRLGRCPQGKLSHHTIMSHFIQTLLREPHNPRRILKESREFLNSGNDQ